MALATLVMMEVMWVVASVVGGNSGLDALMRIVAAGLAGIAVYVALLTALGLQELTQLRDRITARFA